jgi:predicted DNA-binding transcriptional regulator AlpA
MPTPAGAETKPEIPLLQSRASKADTRLPRRPKARAVISADPAAAENRYINRGQLRELIPASDMTLWRWQKDPEIAFPKPVKLGANGRNFWWLPTIRAWLRRREEHRALTTPAER